MLKYITATLLCLCLVFGVSTYKLVKEVATLEASVQKYTDIADSNSKEVGKLKASCAVTDKVVKDNRDTIDALEKSREGTLGALNSLPYTTLPEAVRNAKEDATGANKAHADNSRISPTLMQLLDDAYCSGSKDDSYCTSK